MTAFATVTDVETLYGVTLTTDEETRMTALLDSISEALRWYAQLAHKNLDQMIAMDPTGSLVTVARDVTVSAAFRVFRQQTSGEPMAQESQAGLGYSWSGTYAIPGGGIGNAIMDRDLRLLGIRRQKYGAVEIYGPGDPDACR